MAGKLIKKIKKYSEIDICVIVQHWIFFYLKVEIR